MNNKYYQDFEAYAEKGLKKQTTQSLRAFIDSFENNKEKESWVWDTLPKLKISRYSNIRHELFAELVYPVLKQGYTSNDFASTLWLGKLVQNIYKSKQIHEELGWLTEHDLFEKAYTINPNSEEARRRLLQSFISWLEYSEHEWPSGILYRHNGASIAQCEEIRTEIERVKTLDIEGLHSAFIEGYLKKLNAYQARLTTPE